MLRGDMLAALFEEQNFFEDDIKSLL